MRYIDKLGINTNTPEGILRIMNLRCNEIPNRIEHCSYDENNEIVACNTCKLNRLFSEIPVKTVRRWETIKSDDDWKRFCGKFYGDVFCQDELLYLLGMEKVEVVDTDSMNNIRSFYD